MMSLASPSRRTFVRCGLAGLAGAAAPSMLAASSPPSAGVQPRPPEGIRSVVRDEVLFAGIRAPITERAQLEPRLELLREACGSLIVGPLTHVFRFDTPVEGFDSELGFPVSSAVDDGPVRSHVLRRMHFYTRSHDGPATTIRDTSRALYEYMRTTGLSPELELVEVYPDDRLPGEGSSRVEVMASYLAWPEVYREQLERVLGAEAAAAVWQGGERLTPHTPVDPRCEWVATSIDRLRRCSNLDEQFDILSRVALVRPPEDVQAAREVYDSAGGDVEAVFRALQEKLEATRTGGFVDPPRFDGRVLHLSKVPYDRAAYEAARNPLERRRAYCFCNLVREASNPRIDPVFCYRAAGWDRQLWEPILGVELERCVLTHSILQGDDFCAWDFVMP